MYKLLLFALTLLLAQAATAQDTIFTKMNTRFDCAIVDVEGYYLLIKMKERQGEITRVALNQIVSIRMTDTLRAAELSSKSIAFKVLVNQQSELLRFNANGDAFIPNQQVRNAGVRMRSAGAALITGTIIGFGGSLVAISPSMIESGKSREILLITGAVNLVLYVAGFINLVQAGRELESVFIKP